MATRKANLKAVLARPAGVFPIARAIGPSVPAAMLQMLGGTSVQRTTVQEFDCAPSILGAVAFNGDVRVLVGSGFAISPDTQIRVVWPVSFDADVWLRLRQMAQALADTRISVSGAFEGLADLGVVVCHPVALDLDSLQNVILVTHISVDSDTWLRVWGKCRKHWDTKILSILAIDQVGDVALYMRRAVDSERDAQQVVFAILVQESHVIQT